MASINMKYTDYYKSGKHRENCLQAISKANEVLSQKLFSRKEEYLKKPSLCKKCSNVLPYEKRKNAFCTKSCAVTFNNLGRHRSESSKAKTSASLKGRKNPYVVTPLRKKQDPVLHTCRICRSEKKVDFIHRNRTTCGSEYCIVQAKVGERKYPNGRRKLFWFYNPNQDKEVLLESSWEVEVAKILVDSNLKWTRPAPIKWIDEKNKNRFYYPDFYLTDYNVYLDPKNPFGMKRDKYKIEQVSKIINLLAGDISIIKEYITTLSVA